jgi:hypothetical protein
MPRTVTVLTRPSSPRTARTCTYDSDGGLGSRVTRDLLQDAQTGDCLAHAMPYREPHGYPTWISLPRSPGGCGARNGRFLPAAVQGEGHLNHPLGARVSVPCGRPRQVGAVRGARGRLLVTVVSPVLARMPHAVLGFVPFGCQVDLLILLLRYRLSCALVLA